METNKITKEDRFLSILKKVIISESEQNQYIFLMTYQLYGVDVSIYDEWKKIYLGVGYGIEREHCINFFCEGVKNDLIEIKSSDLFDLIDTLSSKNDPVINDDLNLIRKSTLDGRALIGSKKLAYESLNVYLDQEINHIETFKNLNEKEFAQEITLFDSVLFDIITPRDLIMISMNDNIKYDPLNRSGSSPILKMIYDFQKISYIVPNLLIIEDNELRHQHMKKILKIANELLSVRNFHSFFGIVSGLSNISIQKIPNLCKHYQSQIDELINIIIPSDNFKIYRNLIKKGVDKETIPYIGLVVTEIKHSIEGDLYDSEGNIMWETLSKVITTINNVQKLQQNFNISRIAPSKEYKSIRWINNFTTNNNDEELYDMALKLSVRRSSDESGDHNKKYMTLGKRNKNKNRMSSERTDTIDPSIIDNINDSSYNKKNPKIKYKNTQSPSLRQNHDDVPTQTIIAKPNIDITFLPVNDPDNNPPLHTDPERKNLRTKRISMSSLNKFFGTDLNSLIDEVNPTKEEYKNHNHNHISTSKGNMNIFVKMHSDIAEWSPFIVREWIQFIGMGIYSQRFFEEEIDGEALFQLTYEHIKNDLNVAKLGHRLFILRKIKELYNYSHN